MRRRAVLGFVGIGLVGIVTWVALRVLHPTIGPSLEAVSVQRLSSQGIVLLNPPPWDPPRVTRAEAEQAAITQAPGGPVLQSVLAEVILTNAGWKQPRLCWVVSLPGLLVSSHGPPGSLQRHAAYYLIFIDAHSGEFVQGSAGG